MGAYYIKQPRRDDPLQRDPVVMILHDAGGDGSEILGNRRLIEALNARGYAVIVPIASKRKYVRHSLGTKERRVGKFTGQSAGNKSKRKYVLQPLLGELRDLRPGRDRGWYFTNTDVEVVQNANLIINNRQETPKGRNEEAFIREVLDDASQRFFVDLDNVIVAGLGHGASLTWQLACTSPSVARLFAPVNGAYWMKPPETCDIGGKVVHTHDESNGFWPVDGTETTPDRFGQASVWKTVEAFAITQSCELATSNDRSDQLGVGWHDWQDCKYGSVRLNILDGKFAFQDWWVDEVLNAVKSDIAEPETAAPATRPRPKFMKPKKISKN